MTSVLAIDTADRSAAWVLRTDATGTVLDRRELRGGELDTGLGAALIELLTNDVAAVVVLTGPGSYSGVRAGMAAALGLATVRGVPLHGIGNLVAVAAAASVANGERIRAVSDAGRGGVYEVDFVGRDGVVEELSPVRRVAAALPYAGAGTRTVATTAIPGLAADRVEAVAALAAAVPLALAQPPLGAAGLAAIHAVPG